MIAISDKVTEFLGEEEQQQQQKSANGECPGNKNGLFATTMDNKVKFFKFIEQLNKTKGECGSS